jgi:glycosidase
MMENGTVSDEGRYALDKPERVEARTPEWTKHAIWYQIMVDRFRNGEKSNDPERTMSWGQSWYAPSPWEGRDGQSFYEWYVFDRMCGGDLQGLCEKLDHLSQLGVNALYLNPIFQAESCHKYNATSYLHVDDRYGQLGEYEKAENEEDLLDPSTWRWTKSDRLFLDFLREAKSRGFRVIIDGVFNHVGTAHPAFRDVLRKGRESRFADWFDVRNWDPFEYEGWAGFGGLPAFKKNEDGIECQAVKDHIFAITRRWMDPNGDGDPSDGIDGWRLDVPNEIPLPFWIDWCAEVRSINPEAYISGEIWDQADEWLDGRSFDAVMNYEFAKVLFDWIGADERKITPTQADERLASLRKAYPTEITYSLQNLIDSHDTDRAVSKLHNPDRPYDNDNREQDDPNYDGGRPPEEAYKRLKLLALFQMTYVGAPMIYYGDEVGMWGSDDPNNRKPMLWSDLEANEDSEAKVMPKMLESYTRMIALRRDHPALRIGSFETILTDDDQDVWMYRRIDQDEEILVAINASITSTEIRLPEGDWLQIYSESEDGDRLDALSGKVWLKRR